MFDFAFVVVSYNQEKYVAQHLQSIKYQIKQYGDGKKIQIVFSDDASKDKTVEIARKWLDENSYLFEQIDVLTHVENVGTIRNMYDAICKSDSKHFKMLACDDLYFQNNIFEILDEADIVLTPTISFWDNGKVEQLLTPEYYQLLRNKETKQVKKIRKMLKYNQCIPSPGVFMSDKFWKEKEFVDYIMQFKYIEDIPEWDYIFNKKCRFDFTVKVMNKPYILYRRASGISNSIKHDKSNPIDIEYARIRKDIPAREDFKPKFINIFRYHHFWETHVINKICIYRWNKTNYFEQWNTAINQVKKYIDVLKFDIDK